jgi:hypothetical protein
MESNRFVLITNKIALLKGALFLFLYTMRKYISLLLLVLIHSSVEAQFRKVNKTTSTENHFYIHGIIYQYDILKGTEAPAPHAQVVVYQNSELYVAFFAGEDGSYSFFLPIGFEYEVAFGGSAFVNKKLKVDATQLPEEKTPREIGLDFTLFRSVDDVDFAVLNEPFVRMNYDPEADDLRIDEAFTRTRKTELDKVLKKAKKQLQLQKN